MSLENTGRTLLIIASIIACSEMVVCCPDVKTKNKYKVAVVLALIAFALAVGGALILDLCC